MRPINFNNPLVLPNGNVIDIAASNNYVEQSIVGEYKGHNIIRKVIEFTTPASSNLYVVVDNTLNLNDTIISVGGTVGGTFYNDINYYSSATANCTYSIDDEGLKIKVGSSKVSVRAIISITYIEGYSLQDVNTLSE